MSLLKYASDAASAHNKVKVQPTAPQPITTPASDNTPSTTSHVTLPPQLPSVEVLAVVSLPTSSTLPSQSASFPSSSSSTVPQAAPAFNFPTPAPAPATSMIPPSLPTFNGFSVPPPAATSADSSGFTEGFSIGQITADTENRRHIRGKRSSKK